MVNKKEKYIQFYMDIAQRVSQMSYAVRLQVGSVLVKNDNIISFGWNGTPKGWDNSCEYELSDGTLKTKPETLHAEANSILKVARSTESSEGATLFCTHAPCIDCAKLIHQAGISTVYYRNQYRSTDGIEFLRDSGVDVHHNV